MFDNAVQLVHLATERWGDPLLSGEHALCLAAARGETCSLADEAVAPILTRESVRYSWETWSVGREVRPRVLAWLLTSPEARPLIHARGVRLAHALIADPDSDESDRLDLESAAVLHAFELDRCALPGGIDLTGATSRAVTLRGCHVRCIYADDLNASGAVDLSDGCVVPEGVYLDSARIRGHLDCADMKVDAGSADGAVAISASYIRVAGNIRMYGEFVATGGVRISYAVIGQSLLCNGATIDAGDQRGGHAFDLDGLRVRRGVRMGAGFQARGTVRLMGARIGGQLHCGGGRFDPIPGKDAAALAADGALIRESVYLSKGFVASGEVRFCSSKLGSNLYCSHASFDAGSDDAGVAFQAGDMRVAGSVAFDEGFVCRGRVWLLSAVICGQLDCSGASITANERCKSDAVSADGIQVGGHVFLDGGFRAFGQVSMCNARFGRDLILGGALDSGPAANGIAFHADGVQVAGDIDIGKECQSRGSIRIASASVDGDINCCGCSLDAGPSTNGAALDLDGIRIRGSLRFKRGFRARGEVVLMSATIGSQIACDNCRFDAGDRVDSDAISAERIRVGGHVFFCEGFEAIGAVLLKDARIEGDLDCSGATFAAGSKSDGCAISAAGINVVGCAFLNNGFACTGQVFLPGAHIGVDLLCGGKFVAIEGADGDAIYANDIHVGRHLFLRRGLVATGHLHFERARIGGDVVVGPCAIDGRLEFDRAEITECLYVQPETAIRGTLYLCSVNVGMLCDWPESWSAIESYDIWRFRPREFANADPQWAAGRLGWLEKGLPESGENEEKASADEPPDERAYAALADALRASGNRRESERVQLYALRRIRRAELRAVLRTRVAWKWPGAALRWAARKGFDVLLRYGFAPARPLVWLLGLFVMSGVVFGAAARQGMFIRVDAERGAIGRPTGPDRSLPESPAPNASRRDAPALNAWIYSLDTMLPLIDLHEMSRWIPDRRAGASVLGVRLAKAGAMLQCYWWFHVVAGWGLSVLAIVAGAGSVRGRRKA